MIDTVIPAPAPRVRVDRIVIFRAGLAMADAEGLSSVSMRAVADRLGVAPMTLYRHVPSKAGLHGGLVELVLREIVQTPASPGSDPVDHLVGAVLAAGQAHPEVFGLVLERIRSARVAGVLHDAFRVALVSSGVPWSNVFLAAEAITTVVIGVVAAEVAGEAAGRPGGNGAPGDDRVFPMVMHMVQMFVDEQRGRGPFDGTARAAAPGPRLTP